MLQDVPKSQRERLFHIDFRALFLGGIARADLTTRFGIKEAAATRDLALYRSLAPENLDFHGSSKTYRTAAAFRPLFDHDPLRSLTAIAEGVGDDLADAVAPHLRTEHPLRLNPPAIETVAPISCAIAQGSAVEISYHSLTSGASVRQIVPHALVDTGVRWHVRAWDRRRERFGDFVLTRIAQATPVAGAIPDHECREADDQWMRMVVLDLIPHPGLTQTKTVARDYSMIDEHLRVRLRAAVCGYALVHWQADATSDHSLDPARHHLWLTNREALYGVENLAIAPGWIPD